MLRVALCDDNHNIVHKYAELLTAIADKHKVDIELSCFYSGESLLFHFCDAPEQADIIYLDIMMDQLDGMEAARKLREYGCNAQIIFLTSCEDYVFGAFDVHALQYLVKEDTSMDKFERVFLNAVQFASKKEDEMFLFEFDGKTGAIPLAEISHFEIWKRVVMVRYGDRKAAKFYASMEQLEKRLSGKGFIRVHRSYLVSLPYITLLQSQRLQLKTGEVIPVGGTYVDSLKKALYDYASRFHVYNARGEMKT